MNNGIMNDQRIQRLFESAVKPQRIWETIKKLGIQGVTRKQVFDEYDKLTTNRQKELSELTRVVKPKYDPIIPIGGPLHQLQCDLFFLTKPLVGIVAILTCIDVYSRFVWVYGLTSKSAEKVRDAFVDLFDNKKMPDGKTPILPKQIMTDEGTEFTNKLVKELFEERNIEHFVQAGAPDQLSGDKHHVPLAERFHRDMRDLIFKLDTSGVGESRQEIIAKINEMIGARNNSYHSGVKGIPSEIIAGNEEPHQEQEPLEKLPIGTTVRHAIIRTTGTAFKKQTQRWSDEKYKITGYSGVKYTINDGTNLEWFRRELLPVD